MKTIASMAFHNAPSEDSDQTVHMFEGTFSDIVAHILTQMSNS